MSPITLEPTRAPAPVLRPHSPLPEYYADAAERRRFLTQVFNDTAGDYDRIEALLALGTGRRYRRQALERAGLAPGMNVLDVGCGTGLLAREALALIGAGGTLIGVDPSPGMLASAQIPGASFRVGRAEALDLPSASVDFVCMGYALRHIDDLNAVFAEFRRVLRPGGRLLLLEITRPESWVGRLALKAYMRTWVPLAARLVARSGGTSRLWRYYWDTIEACVAPAQVLQALADAGLADVQRHVELRIFSEYTARAPRA